MDSRLFAFASLLVPALHPAAAQRQDHSGSFITTLGRDTVAIETYERRASKVTGEIVLRVPTTVRFRYVIHLRADGTLSRSKVELIPLRNDRARWVVVTEYRGDSARVEFDSAGTRTAVTRATPASLVPSLTTGFGSSFGIYTSIAMLQLSLDRLPSRTGDTLSVPAMGTLSGRVVPRQFVRRSATLVDVDYFRIAWTHLTIDGEGLIQRVDATETTEKTVAIRSAPQNVAMAASDYAARDAAGRGIGIASPADSALTVIGGASVSIHYSSPRRRARRILGETVPYEKVWRTGANAATVLRTERDLFIGETLVPAGAYSLWTLPAKGGVTLIVNRQHGQWGTEYDPTRDVAHVAMQATNGNAVQENFAIALAAEGRTGALRISWDDFIWTVPLRAR